MHEQERTQEFELADGVVSSPGRLLTLKPTDSDAYVGCCDHVDVISSITNGQCRGLRYIRLDKLHDLGFLLGADSTTKD